MVRGLSVLLAIGLFILWIFGMSIPGTRTGDAVVPNLNVATDWIVWANLIIALAAFFIAFLPKLRRDHIVVPSYPAALGFVLIACAVIGFSFGSPRWLCWCDVGFAIGFFIDSIGAERTRLGRRPLVDRDAPKRAA